MPRLYVQWPTVGEKNDDQYALDVLGAILSGPRTARLTKALVYDKQAAASVSADQNTNEDVGEFIVIDHAAARQLADRSRGGRRRVIEKLKAEGPTAEEIQKAIAGEELSFVRGLESNLGKAMQLCDGAGFHGDPGYFRTEYQKSHGGDGGRREARGQQVPDQRPRRPERRARSGKVDRRRSRRRARRSPAPTDPPRPEVKR